VVDRWTPIVQRLRLPYHDLNDFMNAQIQSVVFPAVNIDSTSQQRGQYEVAYPSGKELEVDIEKNIKITFKLTESYISYWIIWDQISTHLHYVNDHNDKKDCWMEPIELGFLTDSGFQLMNFIFREITPAGLTSLTLSYAATVATYNTFEWTLKYNWFEIS
jgi:hypothetical protein